MKVRHNIDDRFGLPLSYLFHRFLILFKIHLCISIPQLIDSEHQIDFAVLLRLKYLLQICLLPCLLIGHAYIIQHLEYRHTALAIEIRLIQPRIIRDSHRSGVSDKDGVVKIGLIYCTVLIFRRKRSFSCIRIVVRIDLEWRIIHEFCDSYLFFVNFRIAFVRIFSCFIVITRVIY